MIVSKPKPNALIAMGIFILLMFSLGLYALNALFSGSSAWYHYLVAGITLPLGLLLAVRQLFSYKIISIGDSKVSAKFPFKGRKSEFHLRDLQVWKEEVIKTKNAPFRQLELQFDGFLLKLTIQENTNYEQILKFLKKKATKKESK